MGCGSGYTAGQLLGQGPNAQIVYVEGTSHELSFEFLI